MLFMLDKLRESLALWNQRCLCWMASTSVQSVLHVSFMLSLSFSCRVIVPLYESCSPGTQSGIVVGEGVEAIKISPHGQ
jgi:hypothetical protein